MGFVWGDRLIEPSQGESERGNLQCLANLHEAGKMLMGIQKL